MHIPFAIARRLSLSVALALVLSSALSGCGGGGSNNPVAGPTPTPAMTIADVAPSLAESIGSSITAALRAGFSTTAGVPRSEGVIAWLLRSLRPVPLYAQTSNFIAQCSRGGNVNIRYFGARNRVVLSNTEIVFTGCSHSLRGADVSVSGTILGTGTWTAGDPGPVRANGSLNVNQIGLTAVDCSVVGSACNGTIGGIRVGTGDATPPPSPNTCPGTLSATSITVPAAGGAFSVTLTVGATCPWTASSSSIVTITSATSGTGTVTVNFTVAANTGGARAGSVTVNGLSLFINQPGQAAAPAPTPSPSPSPSGPSSDDAVGRWTGTVSASNPCSVGSPTGTYPWTGTLTKSGSTFTLEWRDAYFETTSRISFPATSSFTFTIRDQFDSFVLTGQFAADWQSLSGSLATSIDCVTSIRTGTGTWTGRRTGP